MEELQETSMKLDHIYQNLNFGENWFDYENFYKFIVQKFPTNSHFVEIGCWKGKSSSYMAVEIANSGKNILFDCIDTWKGSEEHLDINSSFYDSSAASDTLYDIFLTNMKPLEKYYNPIRSTSREASKLYKDNSLDFVFIDGDHSYDGVLQDIKLWDCKIKKGGIISGHDYSLNWPGVFNAVNYYYNINDIKIFNENCWYILK